MRTTTGAVLGVLAMTLASAAVAQPRGPATSGTVRTAPISPHVPGPQGGRSPRTLFWIGPLPVRLWAPVAPSYDAAANRAGAENLSLNDALSAESRR